MSATLYLRDRIGWFGAHTGYEQLTRFVAEASIVAPRGGQVARYLGSTYARLQGRYGRGATDLSEVEFRWRRWQQRPLASHVLYMEHHLDLLRKWTKAPKDLIGTVHLPPSTWNEEKLRLLSRLSSALVLYQRDISFFEKHIGTGRVRFIHYGVDVDFFKPPGRASKNLPRLLYGGVYLRNEPMLVRMVIQLVEKWPELRFDLLVPLHHRSSPALAPLLEHPAVTWHAGLNDEELRALYQRSYLMLLPMNESGANTAVVEALSCGLPVATTDVGGIRDYGGDSVFPIVANNDDKTMIDLVEQYLSKPHWRDEIGRKCRRFAEETLAWPLVAQKHLEAYRELVS